MRALPRRFAVHFLLTVVLGAVSAGLAQGSEGVGAVVRVPDPPAAAPSDPDMSSIAGIRPAPGQMRLGSANSQSPEGTSAELTAVETTAIYRVLLRLPDAASVERARSGSRRCASATSSAPG